MGIDVAYISDQRFSCLDGQWYTSASVRLEFLSRDLDVRSWTFWGRLDEAGDPRRLFPIVPPPALAGRVFFEGPRSQRSGPFGYARSAMYLRTGLKRLVQKSDIVWLRHPTVHAIVAERYCRPSQVVVSQMIGDAEAGLVLNYPRYRFLRHLLAYSCRRIVARSDVAAFVSRDLAARYGGGRTDLIVANESQVSDDMILAAPRAPRAPKDGPLEIAFVGRLAPEKCVDDLLRAIAAAPETRLTIVGDGQKRAELEAASRALGVADRVTWCGYVPWGPELFAILRRCSVLALPSATEGLGVAIVEAMSQGLPVVGTRIGGIPELVEDGVSGLLVDVHRPDQLASAFRRLREDPALQARMARAALETARRNTVELQARPLLERIARARRAKASATAPRVTPPTPLGAPGSPRAHQRSGEPGAPA